MTEEIIASLIMIVGLFGYQWRVKSDCIYPLILIPIICVILTADILMRYGYEYQSFVNILISTLIGLIVLTCLSIYYAINYKKHKEIYKRNAELYMERRRNRFR